MSVIVRRRTGVVGLWCEVGSGGKEKSFFPVEGEEREGQSLTARGEREAVVPHA